MKIFSKISIIFILVMSSFFGSINSFNNSDLQKSSIKTNKNIDIGETRFINTFTNFIFLHIKGLEGELLSLKTSIRENTKLGEEFIGTLKDENSYFFDSYFLSFVLLNSEYGLTNRNEYSAELFNFWVNTPEHNRNLFWVLVDFFYINVVPKILNKDEEAIKLILKDTSGVPELTINLNEINKSNEFIDYFNEPNISPVKPKLQMNISVASYIWSNGGSDIFSREKEKAFEFDNKWISNKEINELTSKMELIFWTRGKPIRSNIFMNNITFETFDELNSKLKEATQFCVDNITYYGVNLEDALRSYINTNNELWNKNESRSYIDLNNLYSRLSNKFLFAFNYLFYIYQSGFNTKGNDAYLHLIKSFIFRSKENDDHPGHVSDLNTDNTYGLVVQLNFNVFDFTRNNSFVGFGSHTIENLSIHEIGHVVGYLINYFNWKEGNRKLIEFNDNTYELLVKRYDDITTAFGVDLKNNKLDEVENKKTGEIKNYSNLDTPTLVMNVANADKLYYEIRKKMQSYIMRFEDDIWGSGKDLSKVVEYSYIKYGDKYLDEAITEIMKSYNNNESKVFELKLTPYYEWEDNIDLNFNVINTKNELSNLDDINIDDQIVTLTDDKKQSIELIEDLIKSQLTSNGLTNMNWTIIENGKFKKIEEIDFENNNSLKVLITDNGQQYSGYIMFNINYSLKISLSNLITDKNLGDVSTKNWNDLLKMVEVKYPDLRDKIDIDYSYPTNENEFAVKAKSESEYYGTVIFTFNYIEDEVLPNPAPNDDYENMLELMVIAIIVLSIGAIIVSAVVIIIKKRKK